MVLAESRVPWLLSDTERAYEMRREMEGRSGLADIPGIEERFSGHIGANSKWDAPSMVNLGEATLTCQIPGPRGPAHAAGAVK